MIGEYDDAVATAIRRGTLAAIDDTGTQQTVKVKGLKGEVLEGVHRFQMPGLSHNPPPGNEGFLLAMGGRADRALFLGGESEQKRPRNVESGGTVLYDHNNNVVSIVQKSIRIVHSATVEIVAPEIILNGLVKLGGPDASQPASMRGTIDSAGGVDTANLATRVLVK